MRTTCQAKKLSGLLSYLRSAGKYHRKGFRSNLPDHDTAEKLCCFFSAILYYFTPQEGDKIQEKEVTIPWSNESSQITREQIWDQINATPRAWIKKDQKYTCIRFNPLKQITLLKKKIGRRKPSKEIKTSSIPYESKFAFRSLFYSLLWLVFWKRPNFPLILINSSSSSQIPSMLQHRRKNSL